MASLRGIARRLLKEVPREVAPVRTTGEAVSSYWSDHNVTLHRTFASATVSLAYFEWRNDQYRNYIELMPVTGVDGKAVLDYGCGPGHDLVGFATSSKPDRLIGMDVSPTSLAEARARLDLHRSDVEFIQLDPNKNIVPLPDASVDHVHSSGVLHHTPDPLALLKELRRVLKQNGTMNVMVYNYESIWLHLYVTYMKRILERVFTEGDIRETFRRTTDGEDCPISNVYKPQEWISLCEEAGFKAEFKGAAVSLIECQFLEKHRFSACMSEELPRESRDFLLNLTFDKSGYPMHQGHYAGVDGCYRLSPV